MMTNVNLWSFPDYLVWLLWCTGFLIVLATGLQRTRHQRNVGQPRLFGAMQVPVAKQRHRRCASSVRQQRSPGDGNLVSVAGHVCGTALWTRGSVLVLEHDLRWELQQQVGRSLKLLLGKGAELEGSGALPRRHNIATAWRDVTAHPSASDNFRQWFLWKKVRKKFPMR